MDNGAPWHQPKPSNPNCDLNGAFSSSSQSNPTPSSFHFGSSSSLGRSRPRMVKHRKKHVASPTSNPKGPALGGVEPPKHESEGFPALNLGFDQWGAGGRGKGGSFKPPCSSSGGGFVFGDGKGEGIGLSFIGGRCSVRNERVGNTGGMARGAGAVAGRSKGDKKKQKDHFLREKVDARLKEEMNKLNIGNSVGEIGLNKLDCKRPGFVAADVFTFGSSKTAEHKQDSNSDSKETASIFGSIWMRNLSPTFANSDECERKPSGDDGITGNSSTQDKGMEINNGNLHARDIRKNDYLFSSRTGGFSENRIADEEELSREGMEKIFRPSNDDPWKFKFGAVRQDGNSKGGLAGSTKTSYGMRTCANASLHSSSANPGKGNIFGTVNGKNEPSFDFQVPDKHASKENLFSVIWQNLNLSSDESKGTVKNAGQRKKMQKSKRPFAVCQKATNDSSVSKSNCPEGKSDAASNGSCSPMDFSPFQDTLHSVQASREISEGENENPAITELFHTSNNAMPQNHDVQDRNVPSNAFSAFPTCTIDDRRKPSNDHVGSNRENSDFAESISGFPFIFPKVDNGGSQGFNFLANAGDFNRSNFTFVTSSSMQGPLSESKRLQRKKMQKKVCEGLYNSEVNKMFDLASLSMDLLPRTSSPMKPDPMENEVPKVVSVVSERRVEQQPEEKDAVEVEETASLAAKKTCERWRLRGNKAYEDENFSKAEKYYSRGLNSVSLNDSSRSCIKALMLCYSNRAAARMSLGKVREALTDCMMAISIDPNFFKARIRAANCHLVLGEPEDASKIYRSCLQSRDNVVIEEKIQKEASDGLLKSQQVADYIRRSSGILQTSACNDVKSALEMISKAILISPFSEGLIRLKAEALMKLRCYPEVIKLCDDTLESAERNSSQASTSDKCKNDISEILRTSSKVWRWNLVAKSYFYMGQLEEVINLLEKHEVVDFMKTGLNNQSLESLASLSTTVGELLRMKAAGNAAFQSGRYSEAVEHYTTSLSCNIESRPFAAICFCNRAAGYQALSQLIDAIADCNLAIALNANYSKAISRRATLHEMIRNYDQATVDVRRLISLIETQTDDVYESSEKCVDSANNLRRAHSKLAMLEEESRKNIPLDMYKILGIESSSSAADIKKAYRKAALKHHPDKASQFLVRSETSNDAFWNDLVDEACRDADCLFKMVGEAYAVLSDPVKRAEYDVEEEMRASIKESNSWRNANSSPRGKGGYRSQPKEFWKSYRNSEDVQSRYYQSRWQW